MVMQALKQTYIPFDNYLEGERDVDTRSEAVHHIYRRVRREVGLDVPFPMQKSG